MKAAIQTGGDSKCGNRTMGYGLAIQFDRVGAITESRHGGWYPRSDPIHRGRPNVRKGAPVGSPFPFHAREIRSGLGRRTDSTRSLCSRGHALPLISVRFWCPRSRRARDAEQSCAGCVDGRNRFPGLVRDLASAKQRPRSRKGLDQAVTTASPLEDPCPRPVHVPRHGKSGHCPKAGTFRGQSASTTQDSHVRKPTTAAACPRPGRGMVISESRPRPCHPLHQLQSFHVLL